jgi:hypothetical protein
MSFLSRDATIAKPGFNRWLVPPAAIAVHMCIGQVYGFSVFKKPLARALGMPQSSVRVLKDYMGGGFGDLCQAFSITSM